jgi:hypothetical protein
LIMFAFWIRNMVLPRHTQQVPITAWFLMSLKVSNAVHSPPLTLKKMLYKTFGFCTPRASRVRGGGHINMCDGQVIKPWRGIWPEKLDARSVHT